MRSAGGALRQSAGGALHRSAVTTGPMAASYRSAESPVSTGMRPRPTTAVCARTPSLANMIAHTTIETVLYMCYFLPIALR